MVFVFDLDDTICETDLFSEQYIEKFITEHNLPYKKITDVARFVDMKFDWSHESAHDWYFNFGDEMFLYFPVKNNSVEIINQLYDDGHRIVISTARASDWHKNPEEYTLAWLKNNGLKYHKLYIGRTDKENICKLEDADVFIDDDIDIVSKVKDYFKTKNKGQVFLSSTKYNQTQNIPEDITTVKNFDEMINYLGISQEKK